MCYGIVYKFISPSGGIYIGQTIKLFERRKHEHNCESLNGSTKIFHNAIRKYTIENFESEILCNADSKDELNALEIYYIEKYNSYYKNDNGGYNMTLGGEGTNGYIFTQEDREKLSVSNKKYYRDHPDVLKKLSNRAIEYNKMHPEKLLNHSNFMKEYYKDNSEAIEKSRNTFEKYRQENPDANSKHQKELWSNPEHKKKMSDAQKKFLENNPEKLKERSDKLKKYNETHPEIALQQSIRMTSYYNDNPEAKENFSNIIKNDREKNPEKYKELSRKKRERQNTPEFKENMSMKKREILPYFLAYDSDGNLIGEFDNIIDCINKLNTKTKPSIKKCLNGALKQSLGYRFIYKTL